MKPLRLFPLLVALAVVSACGSSMQSSDRNGSPSRGQVNINFVCNGPKNTLVIAPYAVHTTPNGTVTWHPAATVDSFNIRATNSSVRLFKPSPAQPDTVKGRNRPLPVTVLPTSGEHHYALEVFCGTKRAVIDPDIIIDHEMKTDTAM